MVESIGSLPLNGSGSVPRVAAASAAPAVQTVAQQTAQQSAQQSADQTSKAAETQLSGVARVMAAAAPVDIDRVSEIKKAIANGSFPILPTTIADRLIALGMNWDGHEKA